MQGAAGTNLSVIDKINAMWFQESKEGLQDLLLDTAILPTDPQRIATHHLCQRRPLHLHNTGNLQSWTHVEHQSSIMTAQSNMPQWLQENHQSSPASFQIYTQDTTKGKGQSLIDE